MIWLGLFLLTLVAASVFASVRIGGWRGVLSAIALFIGGVVGGTALYVVRPQPTAQSCALPAHASTLGSLCGFHNPEDIEAVPSRHLLLVTEEGLGGRILAFRPDALQQAPRVLWPAHAATTTTNDTRPCHPSADHSRVGTQGLSVRDVPPAPPRIAIITHVLRDNQVTDALQIFDLIGDDLVWRDCIPFPSDAIGNDIAWLSDGSILATKFAPRGTPAQLAQSVLRGAIGRNTGNVMRWSKETGWAQLPGTEGAIPNGVAVSSDERSFYFADAGHHQVAIVSLTSPSAPVVRVEVGGAPDNLSVTPSGTVLATVATFSGELPLLCNLGGRTCRSGWAVWEIDPRTRTAALLIANDGRRLATGTVGLRNGDFVFVGSMADDRVGVYRER